LVGYLKDFCDVSQALDPARILLSVSCNHGIYSTLGAMQCIGH